MGERKTEDLKVPCSIHGHGTLSVDCMPTRERRRPLWGAGVRAHLGAGSGRRELVEERKLNAVPEMRDSDSNARSLKRSNLRCTFACINYSHIRIHIYSILYSPHAMKMSSCNCFCK